MERCSDQSEGHTNFELILSDRYCNSKLRIVNRKVHISSPIARSRLIGLILYIA